MTEEKLDITKATPLPVLVALWDQAEHGILKISSEDRVKLNQLMADKRGTNMVRVTEDVVERVGIGQVLPKAKIAWYDFLEHFVPYRDLFLIAGFMVVIGSVSAMWPPYSFPVAGVLFGLGLIRLSQMMSK